MPVPSFNEIRESVVEFLSTQIQMYGGCSAPEVKPVYPRLLSMWTAKNCVLLTPLLLTYGVLEANCMGNSPFTFVEALLCLPLIWPFLLSFPS